MLDAIRRLFVNDLSIDLGTANTLVYARELSNILEMVGQLAASDTGSALPMAHPLDMVQRLRPDVVTESDRRETFQAHAPKTQHGLYIVPKVIE